MDNILYDALSSYYHVLELKGYMPAIHAQKLLLLIFYRDFCYHDYRGLLSKEDYHLIEKALNCLWGSDCLIPYPDYLKMSKLCLGGITELVARTKAVEDFNANVDERVSANEELASTNSSRLDAHDLHLSTIDSHIGTIDSHLGTVDERLDGHDTTLEDHGNRISAIESTKVIKEKDYITSIPDINLNA